MESNKLALRAKKILEKYPKANAVWFTADGSGFVTELAATQNAKKLEDKTIVQVTQEAANAIEGGAADAGAGAAEQKAKPLSKMNVEELKAEAAKREGLVIEEKDTKKVIVEKIEAFDAAAETPAVDGGADASAAETPAVDGGADASAAETEETN